MLHLWIFKDQDYFKDENLSYLFDLLPCLEQEKVAEQEEQTAEEFIYRRARLRQVLSTYLNVPPQNVAFDYGVHGKPRLGESHGSNIHFSLSHSKNTTVIATTSCGEIGVDVEDGHLEIEFESLMKQFFSQEEYYEWQKCPDHLKNRYFYSLWTRKEAKGKLIGNGLLTPLKEIEVPIAYEIISPTEHKGIFFYEHCFEDNLISFALSKRARDIIIYSRKDLIRATI